MPDNPPILDDSGERMVPERSTGRIFWEHVERYRFARRFVAGKHVLDIACGEGYGAFALQKAGAAHVVGVDIAPEAVEHARAKYQLDARLGDAQSIPLEAASVDVVVSFETIEHVADAKVFLGECARVLKPGGTIVISTPNRPVYSKGAKHNPFHHTEFDKAEFELLLGEKFTEIELWAQTIEFAPWYTKDSFSAERSFWKSIKGYWRLTSLVCPAVHTEVDSSVRDAVADVVVSDEGRLSAFLNPYRIRKVNAGEPYYWLAVGKVRES